MKYFIITVCSVIFISCSKKQETGNNENKDTISQNRMQQITKEDAKQKPQTQTTGDTAGNKTGKPVDLKWDFKSLGEGEYGEPITMVSLLVNGNKIEIGKIEFGFSETVKASYKDFNIPPDAIIACRGWWAGAGIDYWVIRKGDDVIVMAKEIGETTDENGEPGDYEDTPKQVKSIKIQ
jgi:hypothetical protein